MQPGDQPVPIILHKLGTTAHATGNGVDDFILKPGERIAWRIERVRSVTVRVRRPPQCRLCLRRK